MYEQEQPLLRERIIIVSGAIDDEQYRQVSWCIHQLREKSSKPIILRITSHGGATDLGFALVDLIRQDGNIWGVILGKAASAAATIWLACARRFASTHSVLGLHQTTFGDRGLVTAEDLHMMATELQRRNIQTAQLLADASNCTIDWWMGILKNSISELVTYDLGDMIRYRMAEPLDQLQKALDESLLPKAVKPATINREAFMRE